ncbi:MAG: CHAT domain-containing protein, partial [Pseudomonadota bacterium]
GLSTDQSVRNLICGMADALEAGLQSQVRTLRFVELYHHKAQAILRAVEKTKEQEHRVILRTGSKLRSGSGGRYGEESALALATAALIDAKTSRAKTVSSATSTILRRIPAQAGMRDSVTKALEGFATRKEKVEDIAARIRVELVPEDEPRREPSRMSFWRTESATHVSALTNTAVKPERTSTLDPALVDQLRLRLEDPTEDEIIRFGSMLNRMVVPRDFGDVLFGSSSMVFEVDRPMSAINWEMLTVQPDSLNARECVALRYPFARQLRTAYSPPPSAERTSTEGLRALVVGDPGDPQHYEDLPGAREEALQVAELLKTAGVDVTLRVGAPVGGRGPISGIEPASRLGVLELLQTQNFDILHYAGHGDFQDDGGLRSGWLFSDGLLTANELSTVDAPARLVVANACLSARTSMRMRSGGRVAPEFGDAGLLPGLADEFLRRGIRDYVGTAWEVEDLGAIEFATELYGGLDLGSAGGGNPLGQALLGARTKLFDQADRYGALWAAYQHYGDPTLRL